MVATSIAHMCRGGGPESSIKYVWWPRYYLRQTEAGTVKCCPNPYKSGNGVNPATLLFPVATVEQAVGETRHQSSSAAFEKEITCSPSDSHGVPKWPTNSTYLRLETGSSCLRGA